MFWVLVAASTEVEEEARRTVARRAAVVAAGWKRRGMVCVCSRTRKEVEKLLLLRAEARAAGGACAVWCVWGVGVSVM